MPDTVDKVAERLASLEVTVANGFHDLGPKFQRIDERFQTIDTRFQSIDKHFESLEQSFNQRFHEAEQRDLALSRKIDVSAESLRGGIKTVLDAVGSLSEEMRRGFDSIRKEHAADRAVLTVTLQQHARRLHEIEKQN